MLLAASNYQLIRSVSGIDAVGKKIYWVHIKTKTANVTARYVLI